MFFKRDGNKVILRVESLLNVPLPVYPLEFTCTNENYAELLKERLNEAFTSKIKNAINEAYNQGYRDGRGKKQRKNYPPGMFYDFE